jgi:hypothetical protein
MLEANLNLVISIYNIEKKERTFVSTDKEYFVCPKIALEEDTSTINSLLLRLTNDCVIIKNDYCPLFQLLSVNKQNGLVNINYATMLPSDTLVKLDKAYLTSYNISIIDTIVRKALSYV